MPSSTPSAEDLRADDARSRIMAAAAELIATGGADAATTRAVADAASVQAPTIYRLFGDKRGLLDAVAEQSLANHVAAKVRRHADADPLTDLREGWDNHVGFGLANPAIFRLISFASREEASRAAEAGLTVLRERVRRVAQTGRLRVSQERAVELIHAVGTGVVLTLLQQEPGERDGLSDAAWEAVLAAILDDRPAPTAAGPVGMASALRASLDGLSMLTPGERHLLAELLQRIAASG